jgi:C1A family cysteine protease
LLSAPVFAAAPSGATLPATVDLRPLCLAIRDQGQENSCMGFATSALRELSHAAASGTPLPDYLSPAYLYAKSRVYDGTFPADAGGSLADEFRALQNYGVCPEAFLPYEQGPAIAPSAASDVAAALFRIQQAFQFDLSLPFVNNIKTALANRQAVAIAFRLFQSFESPPADGVLALPNPDSENFLGGHGVLVCGYDDTKSWWIVRNQQGTKWGAGGYGFMPYGYEDFWTEAWTATPQT